MRKRFSLNIGKYKNSFVFEHEQYYNLKHKKDTSRELITINDLAIKSHGW